MATAHSSLTGINLHVPGYVQSDDPGAVGADKYWVDTTGGTGAWILKVRNTANTGWETIAGAGGGDIPSSIVDAKGDIIAATAADTVSRLAVGSNGRALVADSAQATGLKYAQKAATFQASIEPTEIYEGDLWFDLNTEKLIRRGSGVYDAYFPTLRRIVHPLVTTGWVWQNQGSATIIENAFHFTMSLTAGSGSNNLHSRKKSYSGSMSFNRVILIPTFLDSALTSSVFMGFRESATSKLLLVHIFADGQLSVVKWTNDTTVSSTPLAKQAIAAINYSLQAYDDGPASFIGLYLNVQGGGLTLIEENRNAFFTTAPDEFVWGVNFVAAGAGGSCRLLSYEIS